LESLTANRRRSDSPELAQAVAESGSDAFCAFDERLVAAAENEGFQVVL
jgi:hypothetical protein